MSGNSFSETWPRPDVEADEKVCQFIIDNAQGNHICCTAAIGPDNPNAVLDANFKVCGIKSLRVVDASAFPWIPGMFFTATYQPEISEMTADTVMADAAQ